MKWADWSLFGIEMGIKFSRTFQGVGKENLSQTIGELMGDGCSLPLLSVILSSVIRVYKPCKRLS